MAAGRTRGAVSATVYGAATLAAFIVVAQLARAVGYWQSETTPMAYRRLYQIIGEVDHPRPGMSRIWGSD